MAWDGSKFKVTRLEALTDGIFAIVMTIPVLDLKAPRDIDVLKNISREQFLTGYFQDFIVYMIVFISLACIWYLHHSHTQTVRHTDRAHLWINALLLMFVALVPFSISLASKFPLEWLAGFILAANMCIISALAYGSWAYVSGKDNLIDENVSIAYIREEKKKLSVFIILSVLAMAISLVWPYLSYYVFLAAPFFLFSGHFDTKKAV